MANGIAEISQSRAARIAGLASLMVIAAGIFAEFVVRSSLIEPGDPAATAGNIRASQALFRLGFASDFIMLASDVVVALALYVLLRPVNRHLSLLAAFFRLVMASVLGINMLNIFAVLVFLGGEAYLTVFDPDQLQALAMFFIDAHAMGYSIGLIFFGLGILVQGYLFFRSKYVPRILGGLLVLAALVYLAGSFVHILVPSQTGTFSPAYVLPFVAELGLALWLLVKGVSVSTVDHRNSGEVTK
jgi:hypothetical protein